MSKISKSDAELVVRTALYEEFPEVLDPKEAQLEIFSDRIIELDCGWIIEYAINFNDSSEVLIGDTCLFVDNINGEISAFSSMIDYHIQGEVYKAINGRDPQLPWPALGMIHVKEDYHLIVNVASEKTLCGLILPTSAQFTDFRDSNTINPYICNMCNANKSILGEWCSQCGQYMREDEAHICVALE